MQGQFSAAAHRCAIDESESGHRKLTQASENGMTKFREFEYLLAILDRSASGQVCPDREDEGLTRYGHSGDAFDGGRRIYGPVQAGEAGRAKGGRTRVVTIVVERYQRHPTGAVWQIEGTNA